MLAETISLPTVVPRRLPRLPVREPAWPAQGAWTFAGAEDFTGSPDLIVEVISPSTARTDRVVKFSAYERAGVREYWLADPTTHSVEVYALSEDGTFAMAGQYTPGQTLASSVLRDLALPVDELFVAE